ncbi:NAD+ synthase [Alkanindiges sp. WGS2144]|uniref:NAD+ synthase n=1 Tax=Alkanindiges sp. WGS2144 TaxID=3366808 RepID=UPI0037521B69
MSVLTFALAQFSPRIGDLLANAKQMAQLAEQAKQKGADVIVFPELAVTGYPPEDLLLRASMNRRVQQAFEILKQVDGITMVVGYPHQEPSLPGTQAVEEYQPRYNSAVVICGGKQLGIYHKQFLPNYSVFDERRYFTTGSQHVILEIKGQKVGLLICEDIWQKQPIAQLKKLGADVAVVLNASPFEAGKHERRKELLQSQTRGNEIPLAYVNCVGGQDDLVFDGGSMAVNADGSIAAEANRFVEQLLLVEFDCNSHTFTQQAAAPVLSPLAETYQALVIGVRDYVNHSGFPGVILGLSGGIDSALSLAIAVDALGPERVNAVMMPFAYTAQISIEDAAAQANRLNVAYHVAEINQIVHSFAATLHPFFGNSDMGVTEENLQARSRGTLLMALSNKFGHLVLTTGNKSEMAVGYATLYGDMAGGYDVLKDVYKTQVFELCRYRNSLEEVPVIPERVITRPPSAELRPDQVDQDSLPPYDILDAILKGYIEQDLSQTELVEQGFDSEVVNRIIKLVDRSEYKRRQSAIGPRVTGRAFGRERRYPLVNGWQAGD